ncbi:MAG: BlaI/MecI/CopY family transcriptional regulator [Oscillospiraceae bacterium]|nr:BlaI/MecI/CopY family transcriptional regulator [Oscillospiraceae bacterium]
MRIKLFDSELQVMDVIWKEGEIPAKRIAEVLKEQIGWNKNTSYTVIKKCVEKGAIERSEPHFICRARISKGEAQNFEVDELVNKLFDGSESLLFASLLGRTQIPEDVLGRLKTLVATEGDGR